MNLIFFFILAFNDGTFVIERWPTIEICKQQAAPVNSPFVVAAT